MAHAAGVHLDADMSRARLGDFDIGDFELRIRRGDASDLHRGHVGEITQPRRRIAEIRREVAHVAEPERLLSDVRRLWT